MEGIIKFYNQEKGYGFIKTSSNQDLFFHISSCSNFMPETGCRVTFDTESTEKGLSAINIKATSTGNKFIALGNERIKTSNIKNYGISNDSEMIIKEIKKLEEEISDLPSKIHQLEIERKKQIDYESWVQRQICGASLSRKKEEEIAKIAEESTCRITVDIENARKKLLKKQEELEALLNSQEYRYAKNGELIYLYITTYQGDNFKYYLNICGFDIYKKLSEIDTSFGIE